MATDYSADDLLNQRLLRVPDYQRGYAWEENHLTDFWEDLDVLPDGIDHYTGTVVLQPYGREKQERDDRGIRFPVADIVDGQQRLTTIVLLLNELRRRLLELGREAQADSIAERYIWIQQGGERRPILRLGSDVNRYWREVILADDGIGRAPELRSEERLLEARKFFQERFAEILERQDATVDLEALQDKVTDRLRFTLYEVDDQAQVGIIFETLNDRGKPLTELEKVKNYLLFLASGLDTDRRKTLSTDIGRAWADVYQLLMKADITDPKSEDQFLRAHWLMAVNPVSRQWNGTSSVKERFSRREYWSRPDELLGNVGAYVRELANGARAFCDIRRPLRDGAFAEFQEVRGDAVWWSERLRRAGALASFTPLLMAVRLRFPQDGQLYRQVAELCEKFSFRVYRLRGLRANAGQARLFRLANDVYVGNADAPETMERLREAIAAWCPRTVLEREFDAEGDTRNWYAWGGLKYFLYEYEDYLTGDRPVHRDWREVEQRPWDETIEHILPQTPRDGEWDAFNEEERSKLTHDLGNLVLTFDNSSYSNKSFLGKKGVAGGETKAGSPIRSYSRSPLLQEQALAGYEEWTPGSVRHRREKLIAWAKERWHVEKDEPLGPEEDVDEIVDIDDEEVVEP